MDQPKLEVRAPLSTERLLLRPFVPGDFDAVFAMQSDPDVTRWLYWGPRNEQEVRASLDMKIAATAIGVEDDPLSLAAVRKDTGAVLGGIGGAIIGSHHGNALEGAAIGAAAGGATGAVIGNQRD